MTDTTIQPDDDHSVRGVHYDFIAAMAHQLMRNGYRLAKPWTDHEFTKASIVGFYTGTNGNLMSELHKQVTYLHGSIKTWADANDQRRRELQNHAIRFAAANVANCAMFIAEAHGSLASDGQTIPAPDTAVPAVQTDASDDMDNADPCSVAERAVDVADNAHREVEDLRNEAAALQDVAGELKAEVAATPDNTVYVNIDVLIEVARMLYKIKYPSVTFNGANNAAMVADAHAVRMILIQRAIDRCNQYLVDDAKIPNEPPPLNI